MTLVGPWARLVALTFAVEADDFGKEFTPELRAQEERIRAEVERQHHA